MKKLLLTGLTLLLVISGATVAFGLAGDDSPSRTVSSTTTSTAEDVSGPCDEAEHANDPRCTGAATDDDGGRVDNSGPGSLNSGPGNAEDDHGHEDHRGPGHGGDDDSSGPGSGDDD